ncbi:MAG: GIN domain-containing protein, partial [Bacteroidota bacterium]
MPRLIQRFSLIFFFLLTLSLDRSKAQSPGGTQWQRIEISNASRVTLVQGEQCVVWIDGKEFSLNTGDSISKADKICEVDGDWLRVRKFSAKEIKIQQPKFQEIHIKGAVSLQSEGVLNCEILRIGISGVGNLNLNLSAQEILADVNGVGRLVLKGQAPKARFEINGPGIIDARTMKIRHAKVFIDGLGLCKLDVTDSLYADISGGGSIRYRNEPPYLVNRISGLGSMSALDADSPSSDVNDSQITVDSLPTSPGPSKSGSKSQNRIDSNG